MKRPHVHLADEVVSLLAVDPHAQSRRELSASPSHRAAKCRSRAVSIAAYC
jgi:hypothetical protein